MGVAESTAAHHTSDPARLDESDGPSTSSTVAVVEEDTGEVEPIPSEQFYRHYFGHRIGHLQRTVRNLRLLGKQQIIFLVGDSSLDNKYWLEGRTPACDAYAEFLRPPVSSPDVAHWINVELQQRGYSHVAAVNAAVEESTLADRSGSKMRKQDNFVRDVLRPADVVIMSAGGNDIALKPTPPTIFNILKLVKMNSVDDLQTKPRSCWGMPYFEELFHNGITAYVAGLTAKTVPRAVVPSVIYFPDERPTGSWADKALSPLGYNETPQVLQTAIRQIYRYVCTEVAPAIQPVRVVPMALFEALDGKTTDDYVARVEPSITGGAKMAAAYVDLLIANDLLDKPDQ